MEIARPVYKPVSRRGHRVRWVPGTKQGGRELKAEHEILEAVRDRCIDAAVEAYEDAGLRGLCEAGRWEAAIAAVRNLDLERVIGAEPPAAVVRDPADQHPSGRQAASAGKGSDPQRPVRDLEDDDLHDLMVAFYATLERDALVGPYFAALDMREHLPRIVAFWSTALFRTRRYSGNAFLPHQRLEGLGAEHFVRWIAALEDTLDARFRGPVVEEMKTVAHRIAYSMQLRLGIPPFTPYTRATAGGTPPPGPRSRAGGGGPHRQ
jgi:hemoglobin